MTGNNDNVDIGGNQTITISTSTVLGPCEGTPFVGALVCAPSVPTPEPAACPTLTPRPVLACPTTHTPAPAPIPPEVHHCVAQELACIGGAGAPRASTPACGHDTQDHPHGHCGAVGEDHRHHDGFSVPHHHGGC